MTNTQSTEPNESMKVFNYCLGFIDLLGQRNAFEGQRLLPTMSSEEKTRINKASIIDSIRAIYRLQKDSDQMLKEILEGRVNSPLRKQLSEKQQEIWDEAQLTRISKQRWSDGFVAWVCLGDSEVKCTMNGIFGLLGLCGLQCFLGLASHQPLRGAVDIAWGVEMHSGELYGPVVARAYELESQVAQYPRIVVGSHVIDYLVTVKSQPDLDVYSQVNKSLAEICLEMIIQDTDGSYILHYLGDAFRDSITQTLHTELFEKAMEFAVEQLRSHQESGNSKLAFRYASLLYYLDAHKPAGR